MTDPDWGPTGQKNRLLQILLRTHSKRQIAKLLDESYATIVYRSKLLDNRVIAVGQKDKTTRKCLRCKGFFSTDQAYRLCDNCREYASSNNLGAQFETL